MQSITVISSLDWQNSVTAQLEQASSSMDDSRVQQKVQLRDYTRRATKHPVDGPTQWIREINQAFPRPATPPGGGGGVREREGHGVDKTTVMTHREPLVARRKGRGRRRARKGNIIEGLFLLERFRVLCH